MKIAYLKIMSYADVVPGASHWMGRIRIDDEEHDLEYEIGRADAIKLNKQNRECDDPYIYKVGSRCGRFFTRDAVIEAATKFVEGRPDIGILIEGEKCIIEPQTILIGPEPLKSTVNALVAEAEENNWWEGDEKNMEAICDRWEQAMKAAA